MWARYDARVEAMLDMGAAGVVESLLRSVARTTRVEECAAYEAQVQQRARHPNCMNAFQKPLVGADGLPSSAHAAPPPTVGTVTACRNCMEDSKAFQGKQT